MQKCPIPNIGDDLLEESAILQKHVRTSLGPGPRECFVKREIKNILKPTDERNAVHCKKVKDLHTPIKCHMEVENGEAERKAHEGREEARLPPSWTHFITRPLP